MNHASEVKRATASMGRRLVGLVPFAAVLAMPALSQAQVVAGNTAVLEVLDDGGIINPTTVAVRDGVAFVAEGQLGRFFRPNAQRDRPRDEQEDHERDGIQELARHQPHAVPSL